MMTASKWNLTSLAQMNFVEYMTQELHGSHAKEELAGLEVDIELGHSRQNHIQHFQKNIFPKITVSSM